MNAGDLKLRVDRLRRLLAQDYYSLLTFDSFPSNSGNPAVRLTQGPFSVFSPGEFVQKARQNKSANSWAASA